MVSPVRGYSPLTSLILYDMAIFSGGALHGKVGNLVYYMRNGVSCVRSIPKPRNDSPSPAQQAQRARMKLATQFLAPLKPVLDDTFKPGNRKKLSGLNWATKQLLQDAIAGEYPDLYVRAERVLMSCGTLPPLRKTALALGEDGLFAFNWEPTGSPFIDNNVPVYLLVYNQTHRRVVLSKKAACRGDGELTLQIAQEMLKGTVHCYGFVMDRMRRSASDSVFLGTLVDGV